MQQGHVNLAGCHSGHILRHSEAAFLTPSFPRNREKEVYHRIFDRMFSLNEKFCIASIALCSDAEDLSLEWMLPKVEAKLCNDMLEFSLHGKHLKQGNNQTGKSAREAEQEMRNIIIRGVSSTETQPYPEKTVCVPKMEGKVSCNIGAVDMDISRVYLAKASEEAHDRMSRHEISPDSISVGYGVDIAWDKLNLEEAILSLEKSTQPAPSVQMIFSLLLKCRKERGHTCVSRLHAYVQQHGLETHQSLGNDLVFLLSEAGMVSDAQQVFEGLSHRRRQSWNCLITTYVGHRKPQDALDLYQRMRNESSLSPDPFAFVSLMKASAELRDKESAAKLHDHVMRTRVLEEDSFMARKLASASLLDVPDAQIKQYCASRSSTVVGNALVHMYVSLRMLAKAREAFDQLPSKNVISWNTLITGYAKHGLGQEALKCLEQMQLEGISPNSVTYIGSMKACGSIGEIDKGLELHAEIARKGLLETDLHVGSALVGMYAKCGFPMKAEEVFDMLPKKNLVSWNSLIGGYVHCECSLEALKCFERLQSEDIQPDAVTFISCLKACGNIGAVDQGRRIHDQLVESGLLYKDTVVGSALVSMYAKCGLLARAQEVFDRLPTRNVVSWTALMAGYADHGQGEEALNCFKQMQIEGVCPNSVTFVCSLKACSSVGALHDGQELHAAIARKGLLNTDLLIVSTLVDMYAKCSMLSKAQEVFDRIIARNIVSWNALIGGYLDNECCEAALLCFERMQLEGALPDAVTYVCALMACSGIGDIKKGRKIHSQIAREGFVGEYTVAGNALVDMYSKCGLLIEAQDVFDELPARDIISWNALIAGYAESEFGEEALNCCEDMQLEGFSLDVITYDSMLKACGSIGAAAKGQELHAAIVEDQNLKLDSAIGNALVSMYAKCGLLHRAQDVFDRLLVHDVALWTTLIAGYAQLGESGIVFNVFSRMLEEHVAPNMVTFVGLLNACCHAGLIEKGENCFEVMCAVYDIAPVSEHYTCVIDLLCRAGQLGFAASIMKEMVLLPDVVVLQTLLGACKDQKNVELGREAFEHVVQVDEYSASAYIAMHNIYADAQGEDFNTEQSITHIEDNGW